MPPLSYAVGFVLDVELACFAIVLGIMVLQDRGNRALRWLAFGYFAGLANAVLDYGNPWLPAWAGMGLALAAAPVGYACFHVSVVELTQRLRRTLWASALLLTISLPLFVALTASPTDHRLSLASTLCDLVLAVVTALSAWVLLGTGEDVTRAPRRVMAVFFAAYSAVEFGRVAVFAATARIPADAAPRLEVISSFVYVVSCAALPFAIIWMMNARLHDELRRQAFTDSLTGMLNRRGLQEATELALRQHRQLALVLMDLDHFKFLNDSQGHPAGDAALCAVADFLQASATVGSTVGRLGGEEFLLLIPDSDAERAQAEVEALRQAFAGQSFLVNGQTIRLTGSFGITLRAGRRDADWTALLHEADVALYAAKRGGRNRVEMHDGLAALAAPR